MKYRILHCRMYSTKDTVISEMPQLEESLTIIEKWKKKSSELSTDRKDDLFAAATKGFEAMIVMLSKESNHKDIQRALGYFEFERSLSLQYEEAKNDPARDIIHGLLESLHLTLTELTEGKNRVKEIGEMFTQTDEISISTPFVPIESMEEENHVNQAVPDDNQFPVFDFGEEEKKFKEEIMEDDVNIEMDDPDHVIANPINQFSFNGNELSYADMPILDFMNDEVLFNNKSSEVRDPNLGDESSVNDSSMRIENLNETALSKIDHRDSLVDNSLEEDEETLNDITDKLKDFSENADVKKRRRRSSRNASKNLNFGYPSDVSDDDSTPQTKKMRPNSDEKKPKKRRPVKGDNQSKSGNKESRVAKKSDTEMTCSECEYRSHSVNAWIMHLRDRHSTTPSLAGVALRCECGHECLSEGHSYSCLLANFTVIRKRDMPIRRLEDQKTTPQCVQCEMYPKTVYGYICHLNEHHNSTLRANGLFVTCACGVKFTSANTKMAVDHKKKCDGRDFAVHKLDEE